MLPLPPIVYSPNVSNKSLTQSQRRSSVGGSNLLSPLKGNRRPSSSNTTVQNSSKAPGASQRDHTLTPKASQRDIYPTETLPITEDTLNQAKAVMEQEILESESPRPPRLGSQLLELQNLSMK